MLFLKKLQDEETIENLVKTKVGSQKKKCIELTNSQQDLSREKRAINFRSEKDKWKTDPNDTNVKKINRRL